MEGGFKGLPGGPLSGPLLSKVGPDLDRGLRLAWDHLPLYSEATGRWFPLSYLPGRKGLSILRKYQALTSERLGQTG